MSKFLKGIGNGFRKFWEGYKKISTKSPKIDSVVMISGTLICSFLIMFAGKQMLGGTEDIISIADNKAEENFYSADYENSINEYEKLQEDNEWPEDEARIAEIYSIEGEYTKSNSILNDVYEKRNDFISKNDKSKYEELDGNLGSMIAFTSFMNGDVNKALQYGEMFMKDNSSNKELQKTMLALYMANNQKEKAKEIVESYDVDKNSSYDLAVYAQMNITVDNWEKAFELLKESWENNKDELKVYDIIVDMTQSNKSDVVHKLEELVKNNPNELCYKVWLMESYSSITEKVTDANKILDEIKDEDLGNIVVKYVQSQLYTKLGKKEEADEIVKSILNSDEDTYTSNYIKAKCYLENGDANKAFELAKNSVIKNSDYANNYSVLIPDIMKNNKNSKGSEPYFRVALRKEPFNYKLLIKNAEYYFNIVSDNKKAYDTYKLASLIKNNDANLYYEMALIKIKDESMDEATELIKKCISIDNTTSKYHRALGKIYLDSHKNSDAISEIRQAYAIDNNDALNLNNAGVYYLTVEGDKDRGLENLKSAYDKVDKLNQADDKNVVSENYLNAKEYYGANDKSTLVKPVLKTIF